MWLLGHKVKYSTDELLALWTGEDNNGGYPFELSAKGLIARAIRDNNSLERSLENCHTPGLSSIVLFDRHECGGGMIRLYVATDYNHSLYDLYNENGHFTVGLHNHNYDLAIMPVVGHIINVTWDNRTWDGREAANNIKLYKYRYDSFIKDGAKGGILGNPEHEYGRLEFNVISPGSSIYMKAQESLVSDTHTIMVSSHNWAGKVAWVVVESSPRNVPTYIYSPRNDLWIDTDGLYTPMLPEKARYIAIDILSK